MTLHFNHVYGETGWLQEDQMWYFTDKNVTFNIKPPQASRTASSDHSVTPPIL